MTLLATHKTIGPLFNDQEGAATVYYDFDVDGAADTTYELFTASENLVITYFGAKVLTTFSGDATTLEIGILGGYNDEFINATQGAVANLTAGAIILPPAVEGAPNRLNLPVRLPSADQVILSFANGPMTAGKIKFVMRYIKA